MKSIAAKLVGALMVTLILLCLLEGLCSLVLNSYLAVHMVRHFGQAEGTPTATIYDEELGWIQKQDTIITNAYGDGLHLTINQQGHRDLEETRNEKRSDYRIIMVGDSFVLGAGVGDDETIPEQIEALVPSVETVNMGQAGYGIDQSYLLFKRSGGALEADMVAFCVIESDFDRASRRIYRSGYHKPFLEVVDGKVEATNIPLPPPIRQEDNLFSTADGVRQFCKSLAISKLLHKGFKAIGLVTEDQYTGIDFGLQLAPHLFRELKQMCEDKGQTFVCVNLPLYQQMILGQLTQGARDYRDELAKICEEVDVPFVDMSPNFEGFTETQLKELFVTDWHYNDRGTRHVAEHLIPHLREIDPTFPAPADNP